MDRARDEIENEGDEMPVSPSPRSSAEAERLARVDADDDVDVEEEAEEQAEQAESPAGGRRYYAPRRKVCPFCAQNMEYIDYKQADVLRRFLSDRGKIKARRKTGTCAKHQRRLAVAIKRARHLALLPFTGEHIMRSGM